MSDWNAALEFHKKTLARLTAPGDISESTAFVERARRRLCGTEQLHQTPCGHLAILDALINGLSAKCGCVTACLLDNPSEAFFLGSIGMRSTFGDSLLQYLQTSYCVTGHLAAAFADQGIAYSRSNLTTTGPEFAYSPQVLEDMMLHTPEPEWTTVALKCGGYAVEFTLWHRYSKSAQAIIDRGPAHPTILEGQPHLFPRAYALRSLLPDLEKRCDVWNQSSLLQMFHDAAIDETALAVLFDLDSLETAPENSAAAYNRRFFRFLQAHHASGGTHANLSQIEQHFKSGRSLFGGALRQTQLGAHTVFDLRRKTRFEREVDKLGCTVHCPLRFDPDLPPTPITIGDFTGNAGSFVLAISHHGVRHTITHYRSHLFVLSPIHPATIDMLIAANGRILSFSEAFKRGRATETRKLASQSPLIITHNKTAFALLTLPTTPRMRTRI